MAINVVGAITTFIVLMVVVVSKFTIGAWLPAVVIPLIVMILLSIRRHYDRVQEAVQIPTGWRAKRKTHNVVVLVGTVNRGVLEAISYARSLAPDRLIAVSVVGDPLEQERLLKSWAEHNIPVELHTIYVALPGAHPAGHRLPRRARRREPRRHHHGGHPGVRHLVVDAVPAQPVGLRAEGPTALPAQHRRHVGAGDRRMRRRYCW